MCQCYFDRLTSRIASIVNQLSEMQDQLLRADHKQLGFEKEQLKLVSNFNKQQTSLTRTVFQAGTT